MFIDEDLGRIRTRGGRHGKVDALPEGAFGRPWMRPQLR
jgi:hypothetical protein